MCRLLVERILGVNVGDDASQFMHRGTALEQQGVDYYAFQTGIEPQRVGFCLHDRLEAGCSPDRLVGDEGLLEIKCPSAEVHVGYLLRGVENEFRLQVQGQLWITGRIWADLLSYNPELPPALVRCYPEREVFDAFDVAIPQFLDMLQAATERLRFVEAGSKDGPGSSPVAQEVPAAASMSSARGAA